MKRAKKKEDGQRGHHYIETAQLSQCPLVEASSSEDAQEVKTNLMDIEQFDMGNARVESSFARNKDICLYSIVVYATIERDT